MLVSWATRHLLPHLKKPLRTVPSFLKTINDVVDAWYKLFNIVLDEYPPQIQKRVKRVVQAKWFSNEISREMREKMTRIIILLIGQ